MPSTIRNALWSMPRAAQAVAIQKLFETTRKGDFAQLVAEEINKGVVFTVPAYLKTAIEALVK